MLSNEQIKNLAQRPKVRQIAVENFLMSLSGNELADSINLSEDARVYKWNAETVRAIREGIKLNRG